MMFLIENIFNHEKQFFMKAKLFPIKEPMGGAWLSPERACRYWNNGKGIAERTLRNYLYAGKLGLRQKNDHTGWYVWVSDEALYNYIQLQAA